MRVRCPSCSARLNAKSDLAGERIPCPKCGKKVLVPDLDEFDEEDEDVPASAKRTRKLVYLQKNEVSGTDIPGTISLVLGMIALACLGMGWFAHGVTYYAAVAVALIGFGLATAV
jgi:DNA-directed RNA polymerase subunit RPC12/RpoP